MDDYSTKKLKTSANLKDIVLWQMKTHQRKRKDMEEEVSHCPPVTIYLNLLNDINIHIYFKLFVPPLSGP
jgi:hypothetical protein